MRLGCRDELCHRHWRLRGCGDGFGSGADPLGDALMAKKPTFTCKVCGGEHRGLICTKFSDGGVRVIDAPARQSGEFRLGGHVGFGLAPAGCGGCDHFGQAVIGLRTDDHAHRWRPRHDFRAFGLRHAPRHRDQRRRAIVAPQPADIRIDLFGGTFADMARVEHDQIGIFARVAGLHALRGQQFGHAFAVIDVHLAAEAFDVKGTGGDWSRT